MASPPSRIGSKNPNYVPIKEWMDKLELNDERMAERLGLSGRSAFSKIRKEQRLNIPKIKQIAKAMGIHWKRLLNHPEVDSADAYIDELKSDDDRDEIIDIVKRFAERRR